MDSRLRGNYSEAGKGREVQKIEEIVIPANAGIQSTASLVGFCEKENYE